MAETEKRKYNITALQRGLRLLQLFAQSERGLTTMQVARLTGFPVSTAHRFLVNLESSGFLNCSAGGIYHLGLACFAVGQAALGQLDIRRLSLPYLLDLNQQTRETIHLTVRHGLTAVYVEKIDSPEHLRIHSRIGAAVPLYCTAVGKVMLAYLPDQERAQQHEDRVEHDEEQPETECAPVGADEAPQREGPRVRRRFGVPLDALGTHTQLERLAVLQHGLQLPQNGRARQPDCSSDLLSCEDLSTQCSRPQRPRYVCLFNKCSYVVRVENASYKQTLKHLRGIGQDQSFLPARDVFNSHRHRSAPN